MRSCNNRSRHGRSGIWVNDFLVVNWWVLVALAVVLAVSGLLLAAEIALVRVRFSHFNPDLLEYVEHHPRLQRLMADPDGLVQVVRLTVGLGMITHGVFMVRLAVEILSGWVVFGWAVPLALAMALGIGLAVGVYYVAADLVPRTLGSLYPITVLRWSYWPIVFLLTIMRPALWPLEALSKSILALIGVNDSRPLAPLEIEAQLEMMEDGVKPLSVAVQKILRNTLQLRDLVVSDVLLPRNQVMFFDLNESNLANLQLARETGHTRFPLCEGDLDRCIGLIHVKDVFRFKGALDRIDFRKLKREMIRVDSEEPLEQAMSKLLAHNVHMALVIDEFRGVEGVLTLERILEQLVGDIRDEFDADESALIREVPSPENELMVDGITPLHDLETHFGVDLSNDEVSTVSGLITLEMGRIPEAGESVEVPGLRLEAIKVDETRVLEALVTPLRESEEDAEDLSAEKPAEENS